MLEVVILKKMEGTTGQSVLGPGLRSWGPSSQGAAFQLRLHLTRRQWAFSDIVRHFSEL